MQLLSVSERSFPPLPSFVARERFTVSSNYGSDILPWYSTMKDTDCFMEYHWNISESENENWREKIEHLTLPVLILYPEIRLLESASQLCLRAVLDTSFVAPLATSFVSIYLVTPLCGHPPYASSHMFFILYHSQAGLVPQLLFVFPTVIHFPPCSWSYATQNCIDCMVLLVSQRFLWFFICACSFLSQLQQRTGKWLTQ